MKKILEVPIGFEPTMAELQSAALATWLRDPIKKAFQFYHSFFGIANLGFDSYAFLEAF